VALLEQQPSGDYFLVDDEAYRRYAQINLPHARTIVTRISRTADALGAFGETGNGHGAPLEQALTDLEGMLEPYEEDPPAEEAVRAADDVAVRARALVDALVASNARSDRLGQHVRNLFECLGLAEEGAMLSLQCGERSDSPLR